MNALHLLLALVASFFVLSVVLERHALDHIVELRESAAWVRPRETASLFGKVEGTVLGARRYGVEHGQGATQEAERSAGDSSATAQAAPRQPDESRPVVTKDKGDIFALTDEEVLNVSRYPHPPSPAYLDEVPPNSLYEPRCGGAFWGWGYACVVSHCACGEYYFTAHLYTPFLRIDKDNMEHVPLPPGSRIFVQYYNIDSFLADMWPRIKVPVSLVLHGSDPHVPSARTIPIANLTTMLRSPILKRLYAQNLVWENVVPLVSDEQLHKLVHMPIGLGMRQTSRNHENPYCPHYAMHALYLKYDLYTARNLLQQMMPHKRDDWLLYADFKLRTHGGRQKLWSRLCGDEDEESGLSVGGFEWVRCHKWDGQGTRLPDLFEERAWSKFVISPRGLGYDCHRTWEALLAGSIPVVRADGIDPVYEGLPVLIVDSFTELTAEFLEAKYEEFVAVDHWPGYERLFMKYWTDRMIRGE